MFRQGFMRIGCEVSGKAFLYDRAEGSQLGKARAVEAASQMRLSDPGHRLSAGRYHRSFLKGQTIGGELIQGTDNVKIKSQCVGGEFRQLKATAQGVRSI